MLFRSNYLVVVVIGLAVAAAWVVWPFGGSGPTGPASPRPLERADQEIVWLNPATSAVNWERFVSAVRRLAAERTDLALDDSRAFPSQTTAVPELAVFFNSRKARLWFRWYKLTGDSGPRQWVEALMRRDPPPLAIIGGGTSDRARDLARELEKHPAERSRRPLLLITSATADHIYIDEQSTRLTEIYPERTFRFCFTNLQMALAVSNFIWSRDDLRPDHEPIYRVSWEDDPYSEDLSEKFHEVLDTYLQKQRSASDPVNPRPAPFWTLSIPYSVGTFDQPNQREADAVEYLLNVAIQHPDQQRPLLILPAIPQPARRFLRGIARSDPLLAEKLVVATGDGIDFNTIYRDRNLMWPIQDLPCDLVFFCHRNPVDPAAFREDQPDSFPVPPDPNQKTTTGTQDLLLYRDIAETVIIAARASSGWLDQPDELRERLMRVTLPDGDTRFSARGNTRAATGVFVVLLKPLREGNRVRPHATLQVWNGIRLPDDARLPDSRRPDARVPDVKFRWTQVRELTVDYHQERPLGLAGGVP